MGKDTEIYKKQGLGARMGFGQNPALLIIDFINGFSMALMYSYRNKVKEEDRKWVRIAISIKLRYALEISPLAIEDCAP